MPIRGTALCLCVLCILNTMAATGEESFDLVAQHSWLDPTTMRVSFQWQSKNLTWADALTLMEEEPLFRHKLADELKAVRREKFGAPVCRVRDMRNPGLVQACDLLASLCLFAQMSLWAAFYWECAPVSLQTAKKRLFEFVIKEASHLENAWVDTESFAKYLKPLQGKPAAATFPNLGGSSTLVSPAQDAKMTAEDYKHIGSFLRKASATQHDVVLKAVGDALRERLTRDPKAPFWLNTEGSGVAWLHVRIDPTPKYYHHRPYRSKEYGLSSETCESSSLC